MIEHIVIALGFALPLAPFTPPLTPSSPPVNLERTLPILHDKDRKYTKRRENKTKRPKQW